MDNFFNKKNCDRCGENLSIRTMSWFTEETICGTCSTDEKELRIKLREAKDDKNYEGCGYIPKLD